VQHFKRLVAAIIPADKESYQRQTEATDQRIEALVYELYGLTEEEIAVVGGGPRMTRKETKGAKGSRAFRGLSLVS
jgi:hypothetical protein